MTTASCPRCNQMVSVPAAVKNGAWVRCPVCQAEFPGSEVLDQLPPSLIVLDRPSPPPPDPGAPAASPATAPTPEALVDKSAETLADGPAPADAPLFDFEAPIADAPRTAARAALRRPSRSPRRLAVELAKVAAGGAAGCALAVLILWWTVGADPFRLGPTVSRVAPWLVPAALRGRADFRFSMPPPPARPSDIPPNGSDRPAPGDIVFPSDPQSWTPETVEGPAAHSREAPWAGPSDAAPGPAASAREGTSRAATPRAESSTADSGSPTEAPAAPPPPAVPAAVVVGIRNAPRRSADDLKRALQRVRGAGDAWHASRSRPIEARAELADNLFQALARLGEVITFVQPDDARTRNYVEQMRRLLLDVAELPDIDHVIGARAASWIDRTDRSHRGVVLIASAVRTRSLGPLYETRFRLPGPSDREVSVMSRVDPAGYYEAGARVLMLGVIVQSPVETLAGYEGDEPMVIMGGYPLVLSGDLAVDE